MTGNDLRNALRTNRGVAEVTGVALLALAVALTVGMKAKGQRGQDVIAAHRLESAYQQLQEVQRGFEPGTPAERGNWKAAADSQWLGVPHAQRLSLAQHLDLAAERAGLENVRVRFGPADSAGAPSPRPSTGARPVTLANYTLVIECEGGFARLLTFVNYMPAVVSIQRVSAVRTGSATRYRVILAVYEVANANQPG